MKLGVRYEPVVRIFPGEDLMMASEEEMAV
jgi:hypothetical protein